jgi:hypothetical protein
MKLFHFYRAEDQTGVSGTGPVVEGVQFTNGWCALRWLSSKSSLCFYQSIEEVKAIHGHEGRTEIVIHDFDPLTKKKMPHSNIRFEVLMQIIEEASLLTVLAEDSELSAVKLKRAKDRLKDLLEELEKTIEPVLPNDEKKAATGT